LHNPVQSMYGGHDNKYTFVLEQNISLFRPNDALFGTTYVVSLVTVTKSVEKGHTREQFETPHP